MREYADNEVFLTQKELALRWKASESCIKNWRDKGYMPFFRIPGSNRVLYPLKEIENVEKQYTKPVKEVVKNTKPTEIKKKKSIVSATEKEWRI